MIDLSSNILWESRVLQHPKQLKIINHKVNKIMHSTVLRESASLLSLHVIGNFLFPTYAVVIMSMLHSSLLKITVNSGLWMLMLSLNNCIGSVHVSAAAGLGPPQMLSLLTAHPLAHSCLYYYLVSLQHTFLHIILLHILYYILLFSFFLH